MEKEIELLHLFIGIKLKKIYLLEKYLNQSVNLFYSFKRFFVFSI